MGSHGLRPRQYRLAEQLYKHKPEIGDRLPDFDFANPGAARAMIGGGSTDY